MFGIVVEPGRKSKVIVEAVKDLKLQELYRLTDCDCIAVSRVHLNLKRVLGFGVSLVYDDEFLIRNRRRVINKLCSHLYGYALHEECLCGKVAVVKLNEVGDDFIPFTEAEAEKVKALLERIAVTADEEAYVLHQPYVEIIGDEEARSREIFRMLLGNIEMDPVERNDDDDQ